MKLIYIINSRLPTERAYGVQVMKMCEALARLGAEVALIYPRRDNPLKEDCFSYYGVDKIFKTKKLFSVDLLKYQFLKGFNFWLAGLSFYFSVFFHLLFNFRDFKNVYTRDFYAASVLKVLGKKVFFEIHRWPTKRSFIFKNFLKSSTGIAAISSGLANELLKLGVSSDKILHLPDGVDLEKFNIEIGREEARRKLNLPLNKKIVLYTGHLYEWKGAAVLLEAARQFSIFNFQFSKDLLFVFVGGKEEDIKKFNPPAGGQKFKINFVGHRPYEEIPYWLKSADVLALPNSGKEPVSRFYTSPLKLFEYMASGRPIVASALPSIREILNEKNSILVESDNPSALADGIKKALNNQAISDIISKQALKDVKKYTWRKRAEKILNFIKSADDYIE